MSILLVFAFTLFLATLISELADRSVLSTAVLFLLSGFIAGEGVLGLVSFNPGNPVFSELVRLALFSVLFTDGMKIELRNFISAWHLPGRALIFGLPLTLGGTAFLAHFIGGLSWPESLLIGAVLAPTDPVFASAIVGREEIPFSLRHLLNVESGLNDGLALPLVVSILAYIGHENLEPGTLILKLVLGVMLGIGLPWLAARVEKTRFFKVSQPYQPLYPFAVGLMVISAASLMGVNEYLAGFFSGLTVATVSPKLKSEFFEFGELVTELLKFAALLAFGSLVTPDLLANTNGSGYAFAFLTLAAVRLVALELALIRSGLDWRERLVAGWFGPKGFASVTYTLLALQTSIPQASRFFQLMAISVTASIIAHSSTDVLIARWFRKED